MPRQAPRLSQDDPVQGFALELRRLRWRAGGPSLGELARKMSCSYSTVSAYLNGHRLPSPSQLHSLVRACGGDPATWQGKLEEIHEQLSRLPAQDAAGRAGTEHQETRPGAAPTDDQITNQGRQGSSTLRRRSLAAELREIRRSKGKRVDKVAAALRWSPSKVSRYELGRISLPPGDVGKLLDYYEITENRRMRLLALAQDTAQKGWWEESSDLSASYQQLIGLEDEATVIEIWNSDVVPGLLQTEAYARSVISSYGRVDPMAPAMIERLVEVWMRRQQVLTREDVALNVVLEESVLHRRIGDAPVMYEQLQRLAREADRPNLTICVLPLDARHTVLRAPFAIFGFDQDHEASLPESVCIEHSQNDYSFLEDERETHLYRIAFKRLVDASIDPYYSKQLILASAESRWSGL